MTASSTACPFPTSPLPAPIYSVIARRYIADITSPSERPKLMSWIGVIASLCFMFGPGVGAGLSELDGACVHHLPMTMRCCAGHRVRQKEPMAPAGMRH